MVCANTSASDGFAGVGFAIPICGVESSVTEIIQTGRASRPTLGIVCATTHESEKLGMKNGLLVVHVTQDGPADRAGIKGVVLGTSTGQTSLGDVLVEIDGNAVHSINDVWRAVKTPKKVGDIVTLTVMRMGLGAVDVEVALQDAADTEREDDKGIKLLKIPWMGNMPQARL